MTIDRENTLPLAGHLTFDVNSDQFLERHFAALASSRGLLFWRHSFWVIESMNVDEIARLETLIGLDRGSGGVVCAVIEIAGCLIHLRMNSKNVRVTIAAPTVEDDPAPILAILRRALPETEPDYGVLVLFWSRGQRGEGTVSFRYIQSPAWLAITSNYATSTRERLAPLMRDFKPAQGGQLILWHGEPGTGKTYALRALGDAWQRWCQIEYITDPERFFSDSEYMMSVLLHNHEDTDEWRLLILEDTGELLAADAKVREGQRLSRFLNLTDGLLGQGLRVLVLVSTNEPKSTLHAAVARAGRCAAIVEFEKLSVAESNQWLADRALTARVNEPQTVANLYALAEERAITPRTAEPAGFHPARAHSQ